MQKSLLLAVAAMAAMCVSAQDIHFSVPGSRQQAQEEAIHQFLSTPVGRHFTEQQVREAMQQPQLDVRGAKAESGVVLVHETFDKMTLGTNDAPDATLIDGEDQAAVDALTDVPGWTAFLCSQAGGAVYESFDEVGDSGPGYLMAPDMDLTQHQGVFHFKARVKNVNANATENGLQYFVLDNNPEKQSIMLASTLPMTYGEYTEVEFIGRSTSQYTTILFFSWQGKVLVDEVTIEDVIYALDTPSGIQIQAVSGGQIQVSCDPVEGATSYEFQAYSRNAGDVVYTAQSTEPSAVITGQFDANEDVIVCVVARNDTDESYPGTSYGPISYTGVIDAPVALDATNVTNNGFTANWEPSLWANTYLLSLNRTHTVGEEPETVYYMQEDFSEVTTTTDDVESTVMTEDGQVVNLDDRINAKGWGTYLAVVAQGMLGLTNMYEAYGFPGLLVSDAKNFSYGGGKVYVSGMGMSSVDDVVMKVGFAEAHTTMFGTSYSFLEGAQEFELSTDGSMFDVEIEGGTESSIMLFQMVDAAPEGDLALFFTLNVYTLAEAGTQFTTPYADVTLPADATSYNVNVDFPEGDSFTYSVVGKFGDNVSASSEVITVNAPGIVGIDRAEVGVRMAEFFTLDGRRVNAGSLDDLQNGTYIRRSAAGSTKVMK